MRFLLAVTFLIALPSAASAWSNQGHMATGAIAYDRLAASDPAAVHAIVAIMAKHPDAKRFERNLSGLTGRERERALFMWMARWPDDIRQGPWDRPKWHYYATAAGGWTAIMPFHVGEANTAYAANLATARNGKASPADRAVALCWVFHITGDMQQPLHAGLRIDRHFLKSDRLGTVSWVRARPGGTPIELHQMWDHAVDRRLPEPQGAAVIARLAEAVPLSPEQRAMGSFDRWFAESYALAKRRGYTADGMAATAAPADAPVVSGAYLKRLRALSLVRVAQGGERLAGVLSRLR